MHWFEGAGRARLEHDQAVIAEDQPELSYATRRDGSLVLQGYVTFKLASGSPQRIGTRIEFPPDYPAHEPLAFDAAGRFKHDANHHFYTSGRCCLWLDAESRWRPNDPDGIRRFIEELKVFWYRQLMMEANPRLPYPGLARGHGVEGYLEHLEERLRIPIRDLPRMIGALSGGVYRNAPCPCGRRVRYRHCHRDAIRRFRDRADLDQQSEVIAELTRIRTRRSVRSIPALRDRVPGRGSSAA
jgi:hypothetical protein